MAISSAAPSAAICVAVRRRGQEEETRSRAATGQGARELLQPVERGLQAPDAERRAARGLVAEGAVVELAQPPVGQQREQDHEPRRAAKATAKRSASRASAARRVPAANSGASASGPNLAAAPQRDRQRRGRRASRAASRAASSGDRDELVVAVDVERVERVGVGEPGEGERDAERPALRAPAQPAPDAARAARRSSRSKTIVKACAAGSASSPPPQGKSASKGT